MPIAHLSVTDDAKSRGLFAQHRSGQGNLVNPNAKAELLASGGIGRGCRCYNGKILGKFVKSSRQMEVNLIYFLILGGLRFRISCYSGDNGLEKLIYPQGSAIHLVGAGEQ